MPGKSDKKFLGIREIANLAGVSIATVSRVLNAPELTSEATRKKVMEIIEKYDYVPNQAAKNLFSGTSNSIALFVYDMGNPLYTSIIQHLNRLAFENNYTLIICDAGNSFEREAKYYNYCKSIRTSGIIYTAGPERETFGNDWGNTEAMPIVLYDRMAPKSKKCFTIRSDHAKGMSLLVEYLHGYNHRKIGHITGPLSILSARERLSGFKQSMERLGLEIRPEYIKEGDFDVVSGTKAFDYFYGLDDPPTAIIAANDQNARGFIMRANALGVKIPEDFSVCGYNGVNQNTFYPKITTINQDTRAISATMFDLIINTPCIHSTKEIVIDVSMNLGSTCRRL